MINNKGHVLAFSDSPIGENTPLDSIGYNKIIDSLKASTLRCINRTRDLTDKVTKFNKALAAENYYLTSKVKEHQLDYSVEAQTALITGYDPLITSESVEVDDLTGQMIVKPINKWSKVVRYMDRNGRDRASKDISISFGPYGSAVIQPSDSDIYSILDGYTDSYWLADVTAGSRYTLRIQFPASIKPYINYLSLIPFPAFGFTIESIILTKVDGSPELIADSISQSMGIISSHFAPISWGGTIDINLVAAGSVIGIADIDLGLADYENAALGASMVFEVPAFEEVSFTRISYINLSNFGLYGLVSDSSYVKEDKITATVFQGSDYTGTGGTLISKSTFTKDKGETLFTKTAGNRFFIKFTMQKHLAQTPIFKSVKITYGV